MLVLEVFRYLKRRADKRPVRLANFVSIELHRAQRTVEPKVSIIIPTRNKYELIRACVESIQTKTTYSNYEIVIIDNGSSDAPTLEYLKRLSHSGIVVLDYPQAFNYSKISNFAAANSESDFLCFLNNDTEVLEPNWLGYLIDHAIHSDSGVVGSKLLYPDGSIQHLGVALGYRGVAGHPFSGSRVGTDLDQNLSTSCFGVTAVSFACAVVSKSLFEKIGGLDEKFKVGLNDIDFCLRVDSEKLTNQVCGKSLLIHHESATRKLSKKYKKSIRATLEVLRFLRKYNHLSFSDRFFTLK